MNENTKTTVFVAAAALVVVLAWFSRPRVRDFDAPPEVVGQTLFDIKPLEITSLEITQYDEQTGRVKPFKVQQVKEGWRIPYHQNYPADAKDQVVDAATSLTNRTILALVSSSPGDHAQYGVLDPADTSVRAGTTGVGTRVVMRDKDDKPVADLVIGKEVPGERKGLHYVRTAGEGGNLQDAVFEVEINADKFSTNFGDWIEKDLLKMPSTWDIKKIEIRDYSVDVLARVPIRERSRMAVEHQQSGEPRWKLAEDLSFDGKTGKWVPVKMAPNEEPNAEKLDKLRDALGNLRIVDIERKPPSVSASLIKGAVDRETVKSLQERGFYFVPVGEGKEEVVELLSTEGEFRVVMNDGVAYTLRFGQTTGSASPDAKKKEAPKAKPGAKEKEKPEIAGLNRYLFVMVEYDPDVIPKPQIETPPAEPKPGEKKEEKKPEGKSGDAKKDDAKKDDAKKDDTKKEAAKPDPKAERERIEKENKKKQEEYDEKVNKAKERVKELNDRFAEWYYVISDSVYQDIHLSRKDIVKIKEEKKEEKKDGEGKPAVPAAPKAPPGSPADFDQMKNALPPPKKEAPAAAKEEPAAKKESAAEPKKAETPAAKKEEPAAGKKEMLPAPKAPGPAPAKKANAPPAKAAAPPGAK